jgi:DNA-binding transcriptional LysR family regulator
MVLTSEVVPSELLRTFLVIQRTGSFTEAAELLGVTQPAISAHMKRLQQLVGGELFERGAGGLRLTERGETIKHYATRILNLNWQMLMLCGAGEKKRTYRIGIQNVFAATHLASLQNNLERKMPEHHFVINWGMGLQLYEEVGLGYFDAAFIVRTSNSAKKFDRRWDERMCWVCSPSFALGEAHPIPLLSWPGSLSDILATAALSQANISRAVVLVACDLTSHLAALRAGMGICILPERLVPADLKIAQFHFLPKLPLAMAGVVVNEGLPESEAQQLLDAIMEVMPAGAPFGPEVSAPLSKAV